MPVDRRVRKDGEHLVRVGRRLRLQREGGCFERAHERMGLGVADAAARTKVVVIELAPIDQLETVAGVEPVGRALAQGPDPHRQCEFICFGEHQGEDGSSDTPALRARLDVEVIEQQFAARGLDHHKAHALSAKDNVAGVLRREAGHEALPRAHRVEAPDALQALSHGFDPDGNQRLQVALCGGGERDSGCCAPASHNSLVPAGWADI
jgi:hypothetical protein